MKYKTICINVGVLNAIMPSKLKLHKIYSIEKADLYYHQNENLVRVYDNDFYLGLSNGNNFKSIVDYRNEQINKLL